MSRNNDLISVICCYNDQEVFDEMLKKSILNQTQEAEIIDIDNRKRNYKSAATALNYGASIAKGDYLIFAHQDIQLFDDRFLERVSKHFKEYGPSIIGIAGKEQQSKEVYSNITHGKDHVLAGKRTLNTPLAVSTLDEVLIALPKKLFLKYKFDENTCNNWHLYVVDLCLTMAKD